MNILNFPAQLSDYFVIEVRLLAIEPEQSAKANETLFDGYAVDLDFRPDIRSATTAALYTKLAVNGRKEPLPGYAIFVEAVSLFNFERELSEAACSEWLSGPGLAIAIASLRGFIARITSYGPFGKYTLPEQDSNQKVTGQ